MYMRLTRRCRFVESGFWNFDTLFVPQQHPARDLQDTFYIADPPFADKPRADPEMESIMDELEVGNEKLYRTTGSRAVSSSYQHVEKPADCIVRRIEITRLIGRTYKKCIKTAPLVPSGTAITGRLRNVFASACERTRLHSHRGSSTDSRRILGQQSTSASTVSSATKA